MTDAIRKSDTIRSILQLQLSDALISALDDVQQAEDVAKAVNSLQGLTDQWN